MIIKSFILITFALAITILLFAPVKSHASSNYTLDCVYVNQVVEKYYSTLRVNNKISTSDYKKIIESRKVNYPVKDLPFGLVEQDEAYLYPRIADNNKCALLFVSEKKGQLNYRGVLRIRGTFDKPSVPSIFLKGFNNFKGANLVIVEQDLSLTPYKTKTDF